MVVRVERVAAGGDGLAHHPDGRVAFVDGGLPGELVRVRIGQDRKDFVKASVIEVVEASSSRVSPPCAHVAAGCGGCGWQHIEPAAQTGLKRDIVVDALRRLGGCTDAEVRVGPPLADRGLRTTVRLVVDRDGRVGFRAARSHDVVAVDDCLVAHPTISALVGGLRAPGLAEVVLRVGARTGDLAAWAGPPTQPRANRPTSPRRVAGSPVRAPIGLPDRALPSRPSGLPVDAQWGPTASITEVIREVRLRVSAGSFFQSSPQAAEALCDAVGESCGDLLESGVGPIIDAYGGVGLFTAVIVPQHREGILVELSDPSVADAKDNLAERPVRIVAGAVEAWTPVRADLVIADPARSGLGVGGVDSLVRGTGCRRLVLVSCDAASLGRDTRLLAAAGYRHQGSIVLDAFPHTAHVEVVTRFDRAT